MSAITFETKRRNIIPRWRDSAVTIQTSEVTSTGDAELPNLDNRQLRDKIREWEHEPSISTASELLGAAIVFHKPDIGRGPAEFLIAAKEPVLPALLGAASTILNNTTPEQQMSFPPTFTSREHVRHLRKRVVLYPRNAIAWVDMAREYASLGQLDRAKHCMLVAVSLAPSNRFVLRSAARLYVHLDDPERAHHLLVNAPSSHQDPWLIAAELAVAPIAEATPEFVYQARQMLRSGRVALVHTSEMSSALATLEMSHGNRRNARKLFQGALRQPTENTVAQVTWAAQHIGQFDLSPSLVDVPRLFEARTWGFYRSGKWRDALDEAWNWLNDQPFSSRPAIHGSFIASSLLENYEAAEMIARAGLQANPRDFSLLNNLTVSLATTGKVSEAKRYINMISKSDLTTSNQVVMLATEGLLLFRDGKTDQGRIRYRRALDRSNVDDMRPLQVRAAIALALEEMNASTAEAKTAAQFAMDLSKANPESDSVRNTLITRLTKQMKTIKLP